MPPHASTSAEAADGATETTPLLPNPTLISPTLAYLDDPLATAEHSTGVLQKIISREDVESGSAGADGDGEGTAEEGNAAQYQGMPEVKKQLGYIIPSVAIGIFLSAADQTIVASAYGKIGSDLNALNNTSWVATAYFLTLTSFQPLYGKFSDIFGRKAALLFSYTVFGLGCFFCGLARNMNELIVARAISGIGGGGMTTVVSIMFSDIVPLRERGTWQGIINLIYSSGAGFGAPLGGILADSIGWRWAFISQFPLCIIAFAAVSLFLHLPKREDSHWKEKLRRVDFSGAIVLVAAVTTLLVGLDHGGNVSWSEPLTLVCIGVAVPLFVAFVVIEERFAAEPFAPGRVIYQKDMIAAYMCNFFSFGGFFGVLFYLPLYYQAVDGLSATDGGIRLIPGIIAGVSGSLTGGIIMQKTGAYYWITIIGYIILTFGGALVVFLYSGFISNDALGLTIGLVLGGLGNGIGVTTTLIALISNAAVADQAIATACSYLFRSLGSVLGLAGLAAVFQQLLRIKLSERLKGDEDTETIVRKVRESLTYLDALPESIRTTVRQTYAESINAVFAIMAGLCACALIAALFIREKRLTH